MIEIWKVTVVVALVTLCPLATGCNNRGRFGAAAAVTLLFVAILLSPAWWPRF